MQLHSYAHSSIDLFVLQKLGAFGESDPVTPSRWFRWLLKRVPKQLRSAAPTTLTDFVSMITMIRTNKNDYYDDNDDADGDDDDEDIINSNINNN